MKSFLLPAAPSDRARTFYGKAVVVEEENGGRLLLSYGVPDHVRRGIYQNLARL